MIRRLFIRLFLAAWLVVFAGAHPASAAPAVWIGSWGASPFASGVADAYSGRTLRQVVRLSAGGSQVRLRLSNEFGASPLAIGAVHLALAGVGGTIVPGSDRAVTFSRAPTAVIAAGAPLVSDPVALSVPPLARLAVTIYLAAGSGPCTCHPVGGETGYLSPVGDFSGAPSAPSASTVGERAFLTGVDVLADNGGGAIVALGDSLTDGAGSTPDADRRWPDRLAERLAARPSGARAWGVVNAGIGGNRVLEDGAGPSALSRLDRDVLATPGAAYLIVFEAINDLSHEPPPPPEPTPSGAAPRAPSAEAAALIAGYRQIIERARLRGMRVIGATVAPNEGAGRYSAQGEVDRQAINAWIRASGAFDAVIDFDAVWRDPAHPSRIRPAFDVGDHLHANDAGYRALGDAIDLNLFR